MNTKFNENLPSGRRHVPCGRTGRSDEANSSFSTRPNIKSEVIKTFNVAQIFHGHAILSTVPENTDAFTTSWQGFKESVAV
jgi:hypothetical protein